MLYTFFNSVAVEVLRKCVCVFSFSCSKLFSNCYHDGTVMTVHHFIKRLLHELGV